MNNSIKSIEQINKYIECARCSEQLWKLVGEAITALIKQASPTAQTYSIHAYSAKYNAYEGQIPQRHADQVMAWFQEIKRIYSTTDLKNALPEPSNLTVPGCLDI